MITARIPIGRSRSRIAAILLAFVAGVASAQTQPPSLDLRLPDPDLSSGAVAVPGQHVADMATSVHGSFTTGIGYSKNYGNSTVNAAELDVTKQYESGRVLDLHIGVLRSTGLPGAASQDYVSRYPRD